VSDAYDLFFLLQDEPTGARSTLLFTGDRSPFGIPARWRGRERSTQGPQPWLAVLKEKKRQECDVHALYGRSLRTTTRAFDAETRGLAGESAGRRGAAFGFDGPSCSCASIPVNHLSAVDRRCDLFLLWCAMHAFSPRKSGCKGELTQLKDTPVPGPAGVRRVERRECGGRRPSHPPKRRAAQQAQTADDRNSISDLRDRVERGRAGAEQPPRACWLPPVFGHAMGAMAWVKWARRRARK